MLHGWLILDKPRGLGSTNAVSAVKRALRQAGEPKTKVGHGGTLDPLAEGVLPIALGEATKLAGRMLDASKIYDFTIGFGIQTDTLDMEGAVIAESDVRPSLADIEAVLPRFTGPIEQIPPAYSAILIDGQRAYDLARAGEAVEMKTRSVTVHSLTIRHPCEGRGPDTSSSITIEEQRDTCLRRDDGVAGDDGGMKSGGVTAVTLTAHVSKGTYIRSLARDIALTLGTVGHVTMLRRTKAGPFTLDSAISLDKLTDSANDRSIAQHMLPLTAGLDDIPAFAVTADQAAALRQGRTLTGTGATTGLHLAILGETPIALVEAEDQMIRVVRGFNLMSKEEDR